MRKPLPVWAAEPRGKWKTSTNMFSDASSSHWRKYCDIMDTWHEPNDDNVVFLEITSDIRVGYLNVNRFEDHNLDYILWFYEAQKLDVLFLIDTRLTVQGSQFANAKIKEGLGNDILIVHSKTRTDPSTGG